jgi:tetratricopeptide (TPR) repeat protein
MAVAIPNVRLIYQLRGDFDRAIQLLEEAAELHASLGSTQHLINTLENLAWTHLIAEQPEQAIAVLERSLTLARVYGLPWTIWSVLVGLAEARRQLGELEVAEQLLRDGLRDTSTATHLQRRGLVEPLETAARIAAARHDYPRATELFAAAAALDHGIGVPLATVEQIANEQFEQELRAALPPGSFAQHWAIGTAMDVDEWLRTFPNERPGDAAIRSA